MAEALSPQIAGGGEVEAGRYQIRSKAYDAVAEVVADRPFNDDIKELVYRVADAVTEAVRPAQDELHFAIIHEIVQVVRHLGGTSAILSPIGSWGDTLPDTEVLEDLKRWNAAAPAKAALGAGVKEIISDLHCINRGYANALQQIAIIDRAIAALSALSALTPEPPAEASLTAENDGLIEQSKEFRAGWEAASDENDLKRFGPPADTPAPGEAGLVERLRKLAVAQHHYSDRRDIEVAANLITALQAEIARLQKLPAIADYIEVRDHARQAEARAEKAEAEIAAKDAALKAAERELSAVETGSVGGVPNSIALLIPEALDAIRAALPPPHRAEGGRDA